MVAAGSLMSGPFVCDVRCPPINLAMVSNNTSATMPLAATHHLIPLPALDRACATALRPSRLDFAAALEPFLVAISTLHPRALAAQPRSRLWPFGVRRLASAAYSKSTVYVHR